MSKYFNSRFKVPHYVGMAYKTDAPTKEEKEAKEKREKEIKAAQTAYEEFEIKEPEDVEKKFALIKALYELKDGEHADTIAEIKEAYDLAIEESKSATADEIKSLSDKLDINSAAIELLSKDRGKNKTKFVPGHDKKSFNDYLSDAIMDNIEQIKAHSQKGSPELKLEMKAVGDMSLAANFPGNTPWTQAVMPGMIESPYNRVWLADLLPSGTAKGNSIIYPKENGGEGGAAAWTDRTVNKAQMDFDLTGQAAFFKWIAGWVEVDREMLDDVDFLLSYLRAKMLISLKTAENDFILNGTSDTNPVEGMLDAATAYSGSYTNQVDRVIDAGWGQIVEDTFDFYNPTTVVLMPRDAVGIGLNKATGSGEYDLPQGSVGFANGRLQIGGLQVATTTQIGRDNFLVFDRNATMLVRRMQPELRMFEDAVLAKKNRVMFRIEERVTLAIFNDAALVTGELTEGS